MGYGHQSFTILRVSTTFLLENSMSNKFRITILSPLYTSIFKGRVITEKNKS